MKTLTTILSVSILTLASAASAACTPPVVHADGSVTMGVCTEDVLSHVPTPDVTAAKVDTLTQFNQNLDMGAAALNNIAPAAGGGIAGGSSFCDTVNLPEICGHIIQ